MACSEKRSAPFLCEEDNSKTNVGVSQINLATDIKGDFVPAHVICRGGYMTHAFLACDLPSACWAEETGNLDQNGVPSPAWCPAPLTSLPPSFLCSSGVQHVPFTLVCDHRHDCRDHSDEHFCVFPPCSGQKLFSCSTSSQSYSKNVFRGLASLTRLYADDYKLCCERLLPEGFNTKDCLAPPDIISTCDHLIGWNTGRVMVTVADPVGTSPSLSNARCLFCMILSHSTCRLLFSAAELLASRGVSIAHNVSLIMTLVGLFGSTAFNPMLYALGVVMEQRRCDGKERLIRQLKAQMANKQLHRK
ncbi:hypothetical protein ACOMHN_047450 [Nucella lapillus]